MSSHLGVQLASYLLSRATIQTAVVMSTGLGTRQKFDKSYRHAACELQLGALRLNPPLLDMRLVEVYETEANSPYQTEFTNWFRNPLKSNAHYFKDRDDLRVDLVLTPIDGAKALWNGESGSVSVAAAAPRGTEGKESFCNPCKEASGYLVIALSPEQSKSFPDEEFEVEEQSLPQLKGEFPLLQRILAHAPNQNRALGVMFDAYEKFVPQLPPMQSVRRLQGSAVAAALAAFCGKLPYSIFFSRLPQLMQASVAARGLKGRLYAIPLRDEKDRKTKARQSAEALPQGSKKTKSATFDHVKVLASKAFTETDFVKSQNAVVACTSISEICVLDRVRFMSDGTAVSDTLTVSIVSGRTSRQTDHVPPDWSMRGPDGEEVKGHDLIDAYKRYLPKDNSSVRDELEEIKKHASRN